MNNRSLIGACCLASLAPFSTSAAVADFGDGLTNLSASKVLLNAQGQAQHWSGVGRIRSETGSSCTATLLDTRSSDSPPEAPAYLLTNGHCINKQNGLMITDGEIAGTIEFNYFTDSAPLSYPLKRISWSSMQGVDVALVEVQPTLQTLIDAGIQPLRLARKMPETGRDILWVGAPLAAGTGHLRMSACTLQQATPILEQPWVWRHTFADQCDGTDTGASGSPIMTRDSQEVFGVLNTSTRPSVGDTFDEQAVQPPLPAGYPVLAENTNFGSPVTLLNDCFAAGVLITDASRCRLFPTFSVAFAAPPKHPRQYAKISLDNDGAEVLPGWGLHFSMDRPLYRYKKVDEPMQCEDPVGYSATLPAQNAVIDDAIDGRIGINWLCLIGVNSADERPSSGLMRNALTLALQLQPAGPTQAPLMTIEPGRLGGYVVSWQHDGALIDHYKVKVGPPDSTDCLEENGFRRRAGTSLRIPDRSLPKKICTYAYDINGQRSAVREDIVQLAAN